MTFEEKYRVVKRESADGSIKVIEDVNGKYVLMVNGVVDMIYEHLQHAYKAFGRLTRTN